MAICKHCQAELPEHIHFCGRCGNSLDEEKSILPTLIVGNDRQQFTPNNDAPTIQAEPEIVDLPTRPLSTDQTLPAEPMIETPMMQHENGGIQQYGEHHQPQTVEDAHHQLQVQHGAHHQPQIQHGAHHQPQTAEGSHGAHQQPQIQHGAHQQPQIQHGAHHQPQIQHGAHHQPQAVHGVHKGAQHGQHLRGLKGCHPSCLVSAISTAAVLTVAVSALLFFLYTYASPAGTQPTLNVPTTVNPGQTVTVEGNHFSPGLHIWITLDTQQKTHADKSVSLSQANMLEAIQDLPQQRSPQGIALLVKADGTFITTVQSDPSWHMGSQHTIYISRQDGSLIVKRQFTVKAGSPTPTPVVISCSTSDSSTKTTMGPVAAGQSTPVSTVFKLCSQEGSSWSATTTTDNGGNWLSTNPSNGTLQKGASQDITVTATAANLVTGTYTGHVIVNNGPNVTHIDVTFTVTDTPQPCLTVNPGKLTFTANAQGNNPGAQGVTITNGCNSGNWSATVDQSWLALSTANGNINANSSINVNVQASIANMAAGTYTGHVTFYPGAIPVTVTLNVQPVPCISVQGSSQNIAVMQANASSTLSRVAISNGASCASGNWTAQTDVSWITLNTSSGSLNAGASTVIPFTVNESAVGTGRFTGHITFSPGSGSSVLTVNLTVYQNLCITASPSSLSFTATAGYSTSSQTFTVSNCANAGTVSVSNITTSDGTNWLSATGGGSLPADGGQQTFTVTPGAISTTGTYTGTIYVTITGSDGGTTTIQVSITDNVYPLIT